MKSARIALALAAPLLLAAKPIGADASDPALETFRGQSVSACVADLRRVPDLTPDDLEGICGCALDRFMTDRPTAALPAVAPGRTPRIMESAIVGCTGELRPDRAAAVVARTFEPGLAAEPPSSAKPPADGPGAEAVPDEPAASGFDLGAWLRDLGVPAWLVALPAWAWVVIGFLFLLLIVAFRRRDDRQDLIGPPPSMRHSHLAAPPRPKLPPPM